VKAGWLRKLGLGMLLTLGMMGAAQASPLPAAVLPEAVEVGKARIEAELAVSGIKEMPYVVVHIGSQSMYLFQSGRLLRQYPVSTAARGIGNRAGSYQTPLGLHRVAQKFGYGQPKGMSFVARKPTGQIAELIKEPVSIGRDDITSRILWLDGLEEGINRGPGIDSKSRYIYIHGTAEEGLIGQPASKGCVRMLNDDVIDLFGQLPEGALVNLVE